ncbi:hypothetical protein D9M68_968690 [compost metagenome]
MVEGRLRQPAGRGQGIHGGAVIAESLERGGATLQQLIAGDFQRAHGDFLLSIKGDDSTS